MDKEIKQLFGLIRESKKCGEGVDEIKDLAQKLANAGVDMNSLRDEDGDTLLIVSCDYFQLGAMNVLIDFVADLNQFDGKGNPAIIYPVVDNKPELVKKFIERGADLNIKDKKSGWTSFMCACSEGLLDMTKLLLAHGADPTLKNDHKNTGLDIAKTNNRTDVVEYLTTYFHQCELDQLVDKQGQDLNCI